MLLANFEVRVYSTQKEMSDEAVEELSRLASAKLHQVIALFGENEQFKITVTEV